MEDCASPTTFFIKRIIMNKIFNQLFLYLCIALFCASCNNDGDTVYADGMAPSELIATSSDVKLDISQRAKVVLQLAWIMCVQLPLHLIMLT